MLPPTILPLGLVILGLGSLLMGSPITHIAALGNPDSLDVAERAELASGYIETTAPIGRRDAKADPAPLWGLSLPSAVSSPSGSSGSSSPSSADAFNGLSLHNTARANVGVPPLTWDSSLESQALAYAKQMALWGSFSHSNPLTRINQGENMATIGSTSYFSNTVKNPIENATGIWLSEINNYHGEIIPQGNFYNYNHYSQIVWNATTRVGIGAARHWLGGWYVVARYSPAGNVYGQKAY